MTIGFARLTTALGLVAIAAGCPSGAENSSATTVMTSLGSSGPDGTTGSMDSDPSTTASTNPTNPTDPTDPGDSSGNASADCCTAHAAPGCDDAVIQDCVCEEDAVCCSFEWDALCVNTARNRCDACGGGGGDESSTGAVATSDGGTTSGGIDPDTGVMDTGVMPSDCCAASESPGCPTDMGLETCVCGMDPFCCSNSWDLVCVDVGIMSCGAVCGPGGGGGGTDCCTAHGSPGCDDAMVEMCVCNVDPFCCSTEWDSLCVDLVSSEMCGMCP